MSRVTSGKLVRRFRDHGDLEAWDEIVRRHAASVYGIARRGFGLGLHDSEDVFQETFARTYQHLALLREPEAVGGYIRQIARRVCIDHLSARVQIELPDEEQDGLVYEDDTVLRMDEALSIRRAIVRLPDRNRDVIARFFLLDESYATISQALDIPYGTIASRISRGLALVRSDLGE